MAWTSRYTVPPKMSMKNISAWSHLSPVSHCAYSAPLFLSVPHISVTAPPSLSVGPNFLSLIQLFSPGKKKKAGCQHTTGTGKKFSRFSRIRPPTMEAKQQGKSLKKGGLVRPTKHNTYIYLQPVVTTMIKIKFIDNKVLNLY